MATPTQTDVDLMEQARQLQDEAAIDLDEYRQLLQQANEKLAEANDKKKQAAELLIQSAEMVPTDVPMNGTPAKASPRPARPGTAAVRPAPTPKRPAVASVVRPAAAKPAAKPIPARKPAAAAPVERKAKVEPHERNYGQETSLRKEIWSVLDRDPASYKQYLPDYPDEAVGLKVSEVKEIIEREGKWTSKAEDISPQIQGHLHDLKKDGKIHRNDVDRRYFIVEGATLSNTEEPAPAD